MGKYRRDQVTRKLPRLRQAGRERTEIVGRPVKKTHASGGKMVELAIATASTQICCTTFALAPCILLSLSDKLQQLALRPGWSSAGWEQQKKKGQKQKQGGDLHCQVPKLKGIPDRSPPSHVLSWVRTVRSISKAQINQAPEHRVLHSLSYWI